MGGDHLAHRARRPRTRTHRALRGHRGDGPGPGPRTGGAHRHQPGGADAVRPRHPRAVLAVAPPILGADELWCQLFSEPEAGSDLASLTTRAVRTDGGWLVTGHKVWTSYAQFADWGLCLARSHPDAPKRQQGLSCLVVDMHADGVEVRPLVQITGDAEFNEVVLDDVFVPDSQLVGPAGAGWTVANSTLTHERGVNPRQLGIHYQLLAGLLELAELPAGRLRRLGRAPAGGRGLHRGQALPTPQLADPHPPRAGRATGSGGQCPQAVLERDVQAAARDGRWPSSVRRLPSGRGLRTTPGTACGSDRGSTIRRRRSSPAPMRCSGPWSENGSSVCRGTDPGDEDEERKEGRWVTNRSCTRSRTRWPPSP